MARKEVLVAFFMGHERGSWPSPSVMHFAMHVAELQALGRKLKTIDVVDRIPHDAARNYAVREFLKSNAEWLLMLDNDVTIYPENDILGMFDAAPEHADVVTPQCWIMQRDDARARGGLRLGMGWWNVPGSQIGVGEWTELNGCVTAAIGIRRRVFDKIKLPAFSFRYDANGLMTQNEDLVFCESVRNAGGRIFGSNNFVVGHEHTLDLNILAAAQRGELSRAQ